MDNITHAVMQYLNPLSREGTMPDQHQPTNPQIGYLLIPTKQLKFTSFLNQAQQQATISQRPWSWPWYLFKKLLQICKISDARALLKLKVPLFRARNSLPFRVWNLRPVTEANRFPKYYCCYHKSEAWISFRISLYPWSESWYKVLSYSNTVSYQKSGTTEALVQEWALKSLLHLHSFLNLTLASP